MSLIPLVHDIKLSGYPAVHSSGVYVNTFDLIVGKTEIQSPQAPFATERASGAGNVSETADRILVSIFSGIDLKISAFRIERGLVLETIDSSSQAHMFFYASM